ncbi:MAG: hypothetical protein JKY65_22405 [Planctomycetes bacterium]|nr:hypothetical protein [Planctomycetota bacterium]
MLDLMRGAFSRFSTPAYSGTVALFDYPDGPEQALRLASPAPPRPALARPAPPGEVALDQDSDPGPDRGESAPEALADPDAALFADFDAESEAALFADFDAELEAALASDADSEGLPEGEPATGSEPSLVRVRPTDTEGPRDLALPSPLREAPSGLGDPEPEEAEEPGVIPTAIAAAASLLSRAAGRTPAIRVRVVQPRCPFCHDDVGLSSAQRACGSCRAWHHVACWSEGGARCSACRAVPTSAPIRIEPGLGLNDRDPALISTWVIFVLLAMGLQGLIAPAIRELLPIHGPSPFFFAKLLAGPWGGAPAAIVLSSLFAAGISSRREARSGWLIVSWILGVVLTAATMFAFLSVLVGRGF